MTTNTTTSEKEYFTEVVYIPTAAMMLDPYSHGKWVEATEENVAESKRLWALHAE